uniref:Uncharacterized protein n=1 Tax=Anopheles atroparvus TaxID=41427 RepID=A0AAG5DSI7_ANOAO
MCKLGVQRKAKEASSSDVIIIRLMCCSSGPEKVQSKCEIRVIVLSISRLQ